MNHTMNVVNRGGMGSHITRIIVYNWKTQNKVDNLKADDSPFVGAEFVVAIFKIKWKKAVL